MGDGADEALEIALGYELAEDYENDDPMDGARFKTCKYCGAHSLHWDKDGVYWRLRDVNDRLHVCIKRRDS